MADRRFGIEEGRLGENHRRKVGVVRERSAFGDCMTPAQPGILAAGQARKDFEPAQRPIPFFRLPADIPAGRQADEKFGAVEPAVAQLLGDVHPVRTHPQCNQRVVIPFGGRLDQADVHMDVGGELFVKDQRIHPKILPDMRFNRVERLLRILFGTITFLLVGREFLFKQFGVERLHPLLCQLEPAPIAQRAAHQRDKKPAVGVLRIECDRAVECGCGPLVLVQIEVGIANPVVPAEILPALLRNREQQLERGLQFPQIVIGARELSGFLVAAFLWRERQNRVHDLLMFVLLVPRLKLCAQLFIHRFFLPFRWAVCHALNGNFNLVAFHPDDAAFIISIPGCARSADDLITVLHQPRGQAVRRLSAAGAKCQMDKPGPRQCFFRVLHGRPAHEFQPCPVPKRQKIGAEICLLIVVSAV